jgi:hypothetical protein
MNIRHPKVFPNATDDIIAHYSEKDGVDIKYICTTDLNASDVPVDVFYRSTPHPQFGNRYFGLYHCNMRDSLMITNADVVEDFSFGMIQDKDGQWYYSSSHHDCVMIEDKMIDGGRVYNRGWGYSIFKIKDGEFVEDMSWEEMKTR